MNSDFPNIKWRPQRGRTREKKNQLSIDDLDQIDKREELMELLEEGQDFYKPNLKIRKRIK